MNENRKINNLIQLVRRDDITIRKVDNVFYLLAGETAYEVNEIGAVIINALGRDMMVSDLCDRLSQKYTYDDLNRIEIDFNSFIDFLISERLVDCE